MSTTKQAIIIKLATIVAIFLITLTLKRSYSLIILFLVFLLLLYLLVVIVIAVVVVWFLSSVKVLLIVTLNTICIVDIWSRSICFCSNHTSKEIAKHRQYSNYIIYWCAGAHKYNKYKLGMISLSEQRKLVVSKYVIRSLSVTNSVTEEMFIDSNRDYSKRSQNTPSIQPIRNYTNDLISDCSIDITSIPVQPTSPEMPQWEHKNAKFDTDYTDSKKSENTNILVIEAREHLNNTYPNHIKIFTDGSVLDSLDSGAGFVIPDLKVQKYFYLKKGLSIFTSELYAILMALNYNCNIPLQYLISSSVLIRNMCYMRCKIGIAKWREIVYEVKYLIHCIHI